MDTKIRMINHILFETYDYGYQNGIDKYSNEQIQLYCYIDFTLYVDNGGISGFLWNKSPSNLTENGYLPFIKCFYFFGFSKLAKLIEKYQEKYLIILEKYLENKELVFNDLYVEIGLGNLTDIIEKEIEVIRASENVENWIFENKVILLNGIDKNKKISSLQIINLIPEHEIFYQISLNGKFEIDANFETWSKDYLLYQINEIGLMFSEFFIHKAHRNDFLFLDDFMFYTKLNEDNKRTINDLYKYPFNKKEEFSKEEFQKELNLYLNDHFLNDTKSILSLDFSNYKEGYCYFKEPSNITMGCILGNNYFGFSYQPYI